jgi:uncharacterized protein (TIGR03086 family)
MIDLEPAARRMTQLLIGIPADQLGAPTPCPDYTLGDLVDHVGGFAQAFTAAARKEVLGAGSQGPSGDASRLGDDWRRRISHDLARLVEAWRDPGAWTGTTRAGGVDLAGEVAGLVALDELVIHGWDVARASGQPYTCDQQSLEAVLGFVAPFADPSMATAREGLFGPVVEVPEEAPLLDRVVGLAGREPAWSPG